MSTSNPDRSDLPTPDERPEADVVVYDGQCRICQGQIERLALWDRGDRLAYLSLHDPQVAARWPALSHERLMQEMVVIDTTGRRHWGPEAVRYLSRRLPQLWWIAPSLHFPGSMVVWRRLYRWVANNRYRLSGEPACDDDACAIHR